MIWKTKDGRMLDMADMSDGHLRNALEFMEKRHAEICEDFDDLFAGPTHCDDESISAYYTAQEVSCAMDRVADATGLLRGLQMEIQRRGLK